MGWKKNKKKKLYLLLDGVGDGEVEHNMCVHDMLHAPNDVFGFRFRQLHRRRRSENPSEAGQLRHLKMKRTAKAYVQKSY